MEKVKAQIRKLKRKLKMMESCKGGKNVHGMEDIHEKASEWFLELGDTMRGRVFGEDRVLTARDVVMNLNTLFTDGTMGYVKTIENALPLMRALGHKDAHLFLKFYFRQHHSHVARRGKNRGLLLDELGYLEIRKVMTDIRKWVIKKSKREFMGIKRFFIDEASLVCETPLKIEEDYRYFESDMSYLCDNCKRGLKEHFEELEDLFMEFPQRL